MKFSFRWFGENNDSIPLAYIRQIPNTKEVVWALHNKQAGEVWTYDEVKKETDNIKSHGLDVSVVESVNIHDDIKLGVPARDQYIQNYIETLKNLARVGVKVVCYNFMPIFDWTRTELFSPLEDGSTAMYFEKDKIINANPQDLIELFGKGSKNFTLPGWEPERLDRIKDLFVAYDGLTQEKLLANFKYFMDAIIPICEELDIKMAIHPDDPPFEIFGLPRLVNNKENIKKLLAANDSPNNGLTYCTGSLGAQNNDLLEIIEEFHDRIHFVHLRNVKRFDNGDFVEVSHNQRDGSIDIIAVMKKLHEKGFNGFIRPDHGRHLFGENETNVRSGYGLYDRALGITYLNGILDALEIEV